QSSEIEDLVLDLLSALKGERERERAVKILIHDLGDLSYMIEKYSPNRALLAKGDKLIEQQVHRLRNPPARRLASVPKRAGRRRWFAARLSPNARAASRRRLDRRCRSSPPSTCRRRCSAARGAQPRMACPGRPAGRCGRRAPWQTSRLLW